MKSKRLRDAFTLVELLVVIAIIGTLVGLIMPAVSSSRETARGNTCKSNLRQFGIGLTAAANTSRTGALCSGAFDWNRDGAVTEIGWVADLVNRDILVGQMLC